MRSLILAVLLLASQAQADKLAVPSQAEQKKNEKTIRDLLKDAYQKKDQNSRRQLARTLIEAATKETKDWGLVFSFYREAADVAAEAGDFEKAMGTIEQLERTYKVEPESPLTGATFSPYHELRKGLLKRTQKGVQGLDDATSYIKTAFKLADLYYSEDGFDDGLAVSQMAEGVAQTSGDRGLLMLARGYVRKYTGLKAAHDKVTKAHLRILSDPTDPEASQTWGSFLAFVKGDWDRAVDWIAKGKDTGLKEVCKKEVDKAPEVDLADSWVALSEKAKEPEKGHYRTRALYWFDRALVSAGGVEKLKIDKKVEDLHKAMGIVDLVKLVDARDFRGKGSLKVDGAKLILEGLAFQTGTLEFPYVPPTEYTLTIVAKHAGGEFRPFYVGLSNGDHQWAVVVGLNNPTLSAIPGIQNVDGKPFILDEELRNAASVPLGTRGTYVFSVRTTGFSVSVNGRDVIDWPGDLKRLSIPEGLNAGSRKNTFLITSPACRYEIEKALLVPISGQGQRLR
jgi:hypothetical protein